MKWSVPCIYWNALKVEVLKENFFVAFEHAI